MTGPNPSGLCMCGCGAKTTVAKKDNARFGWVKGQPKRYLKGHHNRRLGYVVDSATGCWLWVLRRDRYGYGVTARDGASRASRWFFEQYVRPLEPGEQVDHLCSNPPCVNPSHLEAVSPTTNVRRSRATKLTEDDVRQIRASAEPNKVLAARFAVDPSNISHIRAGTSWGGV